MVEDKALEQIARFVLANGLKMQDFYTLIGVTPQYSAAQFVRELAKIGVEEHAATALTHRGDLFYDQQFLNTQCFE